MKKKNISVIEKSKKYLKCPALTHTHTHGYTWIDEIADWYTSYLIHKLYYTQVQNWAFMVFEVTAHASLKRLLPGHSHYKKKSTSELGHG